MIEFSDGSRIDHSFDYMDKVEPHRFLKESDYQLLLERVKKMKQPVCAVFDKKTALYDQPFVVRHVGEACREWDIVRANKETKFGKNPEDFDLMQIGTFDYQTGELEVEKPYRHLASGV